MPRQLRKPWTAETRATLHGLWLDPNVSMRALAAACGYSMDACTNEAMRCGLPSRRTIRTPALHQFQPKAAPKVTTSLRPGQRTIPLLPSEEAAAAGE